MIFHPNFRISKNLHTKFLDIQKFGWKINKKVDQNLLFFEMEHFLQRIAPRIAPSISQLLLFFLFGNIKKNLAQIEKLLFLELIELIIT